MKQFASKKLMSTNHSKLYNLSVKETWFAIWKYGRVDDVDVPHWKEEWETVDDAEFICLNCGAKFSTNASLKFHWGITHVPTGLGFLRFVGEYFSLPS